MERARISGFVQTGFTALMAGAVSCVLTTVVFLPSKLASPQAMELSGVERGRFESLAEALMRIETRIQDLHAPLVSPHVRREALEGPPAGDPLEEVLGRFDAIERRLAALSVVRGRSVAESIPRGVPNDWQLLDELHAWAERDCEGATMSIALLTLPEVVRRFGTPSSVSDSNGKLWIKFDRFSPTGESLGSVTVEFVSGYVCGVDSQVGSQ